MDFLSSSRVFSVPGGVEASLLASLGIGGALALTGLFLAIILGFAIVMVVVRQTEVNDLCKNGTKVQATVQEVKYHTRHYVSSTGPQTRHYYVVRVNWTDPETNTRYTFSSDELRNRPNCGEGDEVDVVMDPADFTRYHVEL